MSDSHLIGIHGIGDQRRGWLSDFRDRVIEASTDFDGSRCTEILYQDRLDDFASRVDLGPVPMVETRFQRMFRDWASDGIAIDGELTGAEITARILDALKTITRDGQKSPAVDFVAHSAGTVALWNALRQVQREAPAWATMKIRHVYLIGSPLRYWIARALPRVSDATAPTVSGRFLNFVDRRDPIVAARGGGLSDINRGGESAVGVRDVVVKNRPRFLKRLSPLYLAIGRHEHYHTGYFSNPTVIAAVAAGLSGEEPVSAIPPSSMLV